MQRPVGGEMVTETGSRPDRGPVVPPKPMRSNSTSTDPLQARKSLMPFVPFAGLAALAPFSDEEWTYLSSLLGRIEHFRPGAQIIGEGAPLDRPRFVIAGWGCRMRTLSDGRRQILTFYLPGDLLGYSARTNKLALGAYGALTRMETASAAEIVGNALRSARAPHLVAALENVQALEEYYLLSQIARIGRLTAYERFANLMLEFHSRLSRAGIADSYRFHMPLTQEQLGDGLGLSIVHVNRTVQQLKREGLISIRGSVVTLLKPDVLAAIGDYRELDLGMVAGQRDGTAETPLGDHEPR